MSLRRPARAAVVAFGLLAWLGASAHPAQASPLVLEYTGTATFTSGIFSGQGSAVIGTLHFDSAYVDDAPTDGNFDQFRLSAGANQNFDMFMTVQVGNVSRTTADNGDPPFTLKNLQQHDGPTADIWFFEIPPDPGITGDSEARISLRTDGLSDALLPGSGGLTGMPLIPVAENFATAIGFFVARGSTSTIEGQVNFDVATLTLMPTPGAGASTSVALATLLLCARIHRTPRARGDRSLRG